MSPGRESVPAVVSRLDKLLWVLTVASATLTLVFSMGPVPPGMNGFPHADKLSHGIAYFTTSLLFLLAAVWRPGRGAGPFPRAGIVAVLLGSAAGGIVEVAQGFTALREPEFLDWVAEAVGIFAALGLVVWIRARGVALSDAEGEA